MFVLLVKYKGWDQVNMIDVIQSDRFLTDWDDPSIERRDERDILNIPALFIAERNRENYTVANVGWVKEVHNTQGQITLHYMLDEDVPPLPVEFIEKNADALHIRTIGNMPELGSTHVAFKDVDLYKVLFHQLMNSAMTPKKYFQKVIAEEA